MFCHIYRLTASLNYLKINGIMYFVDSWTGLMNLRTELEIAFNNNLGILLSFTTGNTIIYATEAAGAK